MMNRFSNLFDIYSTRLLQGEYVFNKNDFVFTEMVELACWYLSLRNNLLLIPKCSQNSHGRIFSRQVQTGRDRFVNF